MATSIERQVHPPTDRDHRLRQLAERSQLSEDQVIERALDILFSLAEVLEPDLERRGWSIVSEDALGRVWDNQEDARYDDWQQLYAVPAG